VSPSWEIALGSPKYDQDPAPSSRSTAMGSSSGSWEGAVSR
jgi:hypothetical protein